MRAIDQLLFSHPSQQLAYHAWTRLQNKLIACHNLPWDEVIEELSYIFGNMRLVVQINEPLAFFLRCLIGFLAMRQVIPGITLSLMFKQLNDGGIVTGGFWCQLRLLLS
jgi:hypothetical protein